MEFILGFEFEFGWKPNLTNSDQAKIKKLSKYSYFEEYILKQVSNSLQDFLKSQYQHISSIIEDPTIKFSKDYKNSHYGVEIITEPMPENVATQLCQGILKWMRDTPQVKTNTSCGLHINISFENPELTSNIDYFTLLQNTPQDKILEIFGRKRNIYCQATHLRKFPLVIKNRRTKARNLLYWLEKIKQKSMILLTNEVMPKNKLSSLTTKDTISFRNSQQALMCIKDNFLGHLLTAGKNISIVDKMSPSEERYFEFRMIGNKGYESKAVEIMSAIDDFKLAMTTSIDEKKA